MSIQAFRLAFIIPFCFFALSQATPGGPLDGQRFVCNTGYTVRDCLEEIDILKTALAPYHVERLGSWTWVLVKSADWKEILRPRALNADSPALSVPDKRETFLEEALFVPVPRRSAELLLIWNLPRPALLELAITHELGHCLCNDAKEANAEMIGRDLRNGRNPECQTSPRKQPGLRAGI